MQIAKDAGGDGVAAVLDISNAEQVKNLIDLAIDKFGKINGLFNVAANIHPEEVAKDTNPVDIDLEVWRRNIDINLTGYMLTSKYAIPHRITSYNVCYTKLLRRTSKKTQCKRASRSCRTI